MRNMNPMQNTGVIRDNDTRFLGSCFVFRYPEFVLTARHCVRDKEANHIQIRLPAGPETEFGVEAIIPHEKADIAVLKVKGISEDDITWPQYNLCDDQSWGQGYMTCGYPTDFSDMGPAPMARVFQGNIQRFFAHKSHLGYNYFAAELSGGCPAGVSGAPVFNPRFHGRLYGIVTENIKTTTELETVVEVEDNGSTYRELYHNVINYGVALWLPAISEWLDAIVPPVPADEHNRRAANQSRLRN